MHARKPRGWSTVTPRLITTDVAGLVDFLKMTFGAEGDVVSGRPAEVRICDSLVLVSDGGGIRLATSAFLYVYVADVDDTYALALKAGATTIEEPSDTPYGDRRATVSDRWGNVWQIAEHAERQ